MLFKASFKQKKSSIEELDVLNEEAKREPLGLFESVTAWSNKIFPFQFLNGNEKVEDSKRLDAQKEYNEKGERIATSPLEKIFGKDNIFASMISNVIGTIGKAIEGIASNVQKGIGLPFFPNREIPTDADKSDSGHSKRYESREASVKEGGRRVGYRESTEGAKEVDGEKRAIHSTALDGDDAKTGGGERKRSDGPAVSTELGGEAKSWSHSSQGIEKNSLTSSKEESSRRSTNVDEKRRGGSEEVKDKVARESIEVKEEGKKAKEKVDAEGKRDKGFNPIFKKKTKLRYEIKTCHDLLDVNLVSKLSKDKGNDINPFEKITLNTEFLLNFLQECFKGMIYQILIKAKRLTDSEMPEGKRH
ncbi:hypothetical protein APICC_07771 [Apis cerana cerana]|uniref:Uncharacterized protein n=1 Tax=Apis cerana cerana TaxID=94128 RepID=A0A2A3ES38_APICC|nr:hypothetical protein APICC_07771 [Apis cerana cerana]